MDFGPLVKPLGITVKKKEGKVVETSDVVRSQATRGFWKGGREPLEFKKETRKGDQKFFKIFQKSFVARNLRGDWYFYCVIIKDIFSVCWWWLPVSVLKQIVAMWSVTCVIVGDLEERDWLLYW